MDSAALDKVLKSKSHSIIRREELLGLLKEVGFLKVEVFSDYKRGYDLNADYYQYIATK